MEQKSLLNPVQDHLKQFIKKKYFESILPSSIELTKILESEELPILKINLLLRKIENACCMIEMNMRAELNIARSEAKKRTYQIFIYKQLEELYDKYETDKGGLNWEKIKEEKGIKFLRSFPLNDAIEAAKLVQSGELEI